MKFLYMILLTFIISTFSLAQWERTTGPEGISIGTIVSFGDTVYAGTATDGLFASTDDGNTWYPLNSGIETIDVNTIDTLNGYLFAGTGYGIYRSSDWGITWQSLPNAGIIYVASMTVKDEYIFAGTVTNGVLKSSDNGENWQNAGFYYDYCKALCISGNKVIASTGNYTMYTTDYGTSWHHVDDLEQGAQVFSLYSKDSLVFAGARSEVYKSTDYGNTFISVPISFDWSVVNMYDFASIGTTIFVATSYDGVYKSTNNGLGWESANEGMGPKDVRSITVTGSSTLIAGSHYAGVYRSIDQAENWLKSMEGFPAGSSILTLENSESGVYAGTRDGIYKSTDNGFSWNKLTGVSDTINYSDVRGIAISGRDIYAACTYHFHATIYKSTDDGATWKRSNNGIPSDAIFLWNIAKSGENIIAATSVGVYYSTDKGQSWQASNLLNESVQKLAVTENYVFASLGFNDVYRSADDGVTWSLVLNVPSVSYTSLTAIDNYAYVGGFNIGAFYSTDYGNTWSPAGFPLGYSAYAVRFVPEVPGMVLAGTNIDPDYIYASFNYSDYFGYYSEGLGVHANTESFASNDTYNFAGTDYNGVWRRFLPGITPVELISFTALTKDNNVTLSWETATEKNNSGFEIQRSAATDRKSEKRNWQKIGFIEGQGTTTKENDYSFVDNKFGVRGIIHINLCR